MFNGRPEGTVTIQDSQFAYLPVILTRDLVIEDSVFSSGISSVPLSSFSWIMASSLLRNISLNTIPSSLVISQTGSTDELKIVHATLRGKVSVTSVGALTLGEDIYVDELDVTAHHDLRIDNISSTPAILMKKVITLKSRTSEEEDTTGDQPKDPHLKQCQVDIQVPEFPEPSSANFERSSRVMITAYADVNATDSQISVIGDFQMNIYQGQAYMDNAMVNVQKDFIVSGNQRSEFIMIDSNVISGSFTSTISLRMNRSSISSSSIQVSGHTWELSRTNTLQGNDIIAYFDTLEATEAITNLRSTNGNSVDLSVVQEANFYSLKASRFEQFSIHSPTFSILDNSTIDAEHIDIFSSIIHSAGPEAVSLEIIEQGNCDPKFSVHAPTVSLQGVHLILGNHQFSADESAHVTVERNSSIVAPNVFLPSASLDVRGHATLCIAYVASLQTHETLAIMDDNCTLESEKIFLAGSISSIGASGLHGSTALNIDAFNVTFYQLESSMQWEMKLNASVYSFTDIEMSTAQFTSARSADLMEIHGSNQIMILDFDRIETFAIEVRNVEEFSSLRTNQFNFQGSTVLASLEYYSGPENAVFPFLTQSLIEDKKMENGFTHLQLRGTGPATIEHNPKNVSLILSSDINSTEMQFCTTSPQGFVDASNGLLKDSPGLVIANYTQPIDSRLSGSVEVYQNGSFHYCFGMPGICNFRSLGQELQFSFQGSTNLSVGSESVATLLSQGLSSADLCSEATGQVSSSSSSSFSHTPTKSNTPSTRPSEFPLLSPSGSSQLSQSKTPSTSIAASNSAIGTMQATESQTAAVEDLSSPTPQSRRSKLPEPTIEVETEEYSEGDTSEVPVSSVQGSFVLQDDESIEALVFPPTGVVGTLSVELVPISSELQANELRSGIISVEMFDENGNPITQFDEAFEICIRAPREKQNDFCLGFFDESNFDWECEDECPDEISRGDTELMCGKTNHLTNFALLLNGKDGNGNDCDSFEGDFITGSAYGDLILFLSFLAGAVCCVCCVILLVTFTPARKVVYNDSQSVVIETYESDY